MNTVDDYRASLEALGWSAAEKVNDNLGFQSWEVTATRGDEEVRGMGTPPLGAWRAASESAQRRGPKPAG
jgi:hypothetical protein